MSNSGDEHTFGMSSRVDDCESARQSYLQVGSGKSIPVHMAAAADLRSKLCKLPDVPGVVLGQAHVDDEVLYLEAELDAIASVADCRYGPIKSLKVPKCPLCDCVLCTRGVCYLCIKHFPASERVYSVPSETERKTWFAIVRRRASLHREALAKASLL